MNDLPSIRDVLIHYGAQVGRTHGQVNLRCPFHGDTHQSGTANLDNNVFVCFACGVQGNSLQLIAQQEGISVRDAKEFAERITGTSVTKVPGNIYQAEDYLRSRGIPIEVAPAGAIRRSRRG